MGTSIYVASSWRNSWQPSIVKRLRDFGHLVYDFKDNHGFNWSEIDPDWSTWSKEKYRDMLAHKVAERGFQRDMSALKESAVCLLVQPCGTSAHLELGFACGLGKRTAILYPFDCELRRGAEAYHAGEHTFMPHAGPCSACGDLDGCHEYGRLRRIEPELMVKMVSDSILIGKDEFIAWGKSL